MKDKSENQASAQPRSMRNKIRNGLVYLMAASLLTAGLGAYDRYKRQKQGEMFAPERWHNVEYVNPREGFWKFYAKEDVPHNSELWARYQHEVRNNNIFDEQGRIPTGNIRIPDLDGDGKAGE